MRTGRRIPGNKLLLLPLLVVRVSMIKDKEITRIYYCVRNEAI